MENKKVIALMAMGFELVALILVAVFAGQSLDQNFHWQGLGVVTLALLALVGWLIHLVQLMKKMFG